MCNIPTKATSPQQPKAHVKQTLFMDSNISSISLEQNIEVFSEEWLANRKN